MFRIVVFVLTYLVVTGGIWAGVTVWLEKKGYSISAWTQAILEKIPFITINNGGWFLLTIGLLGLITMITLMRIGVYDKFIEKIDSISGFNKFRITLRFFAHNFNQEPCYLTVVVQVKNIGFNKSNLTEWSLDFITDDGKNFSGSALYQKDQINIKTSGGKQLPFSADKSLYNITKNQIEPGESVTGVIQFSIIGLSEIMLNKNCIVVLKAKDNKDRKIKFKTKLTIFYERNSETIADLHDIMTNAF